MLHFAAVRNLCGFALAMFALTMPAVLQAQPDYVLTDLYYMGGVSYAYGINSSEQVVGYGYFLVGDYAFPNAVRWSQTTVNFFSFGITNNYGYGINDNGDIAGIFYASTGYPHAFRYSGPTMTDLGTIGGLSSIGYGINANGQVVGDAETSVQGNYHAVRWTGTTAEDLGTLGGTGSSARGINDSGQVTGSAATQTASHAFRYSGSTMTDLGTLGGTNSGGTGINASGQVVGSAQTKNNAAYHAVVWTGTTAADLGTLGGTNSYGEAINSFGDVVGESDTIAGDSHVFLYSGGRMIDLNSLVTNFYLREAHGINDSGWVTGSGGPQIYDNSHAYLLRPIVNVTVSGTIALDGVPDLTAVNPAVPFSHLLFEFRTPGTTTALITKSLVLTPVGAGSPNGTFSIPKIPAAVYDIAISLSKSLRYVAKSVDVGANPNLPGITLLGGNATGAGGSANTVDYDDFLVLLSAFNSDISDPASGYNWAADFNYDGKVDFDDFLILLGNFGVKADL